MGIGKDKLLHALVCFALDIVCAVLGMWNPFQRVVFVALVGAAKEVYDMTHDGHDAEWADFAADIIGAVAGEIVVLVLHGVR